jgi:hypothetical protein
MLYLFLTLFACSDWTMSTVKLREADILAFPSHINFGHLIAGDESDADSFAVINTGDGVLTVYSVDLISGNSRFGLTTPEGGPYLIEPGEHVDFGVYYTPETFESNGAYIEIKSDDSDEPEVRIHLEGYGDAPLISVEPQVTDYGDISIGCDNEERITIRNNGNMDLIIDEITQLVTQPVDIILEFGSLPPPPWIIAPNTELDFLISYVPLDIGGDRSEIEIESNDPANKVVIVTQEGRGDIEQWHVESWEQDEVALLDILWVIDDSGSMMPFQTALGTNISSFFSNFLLSAPDYHMAVITTSDYRVPYYIDNATPNPALTLSQMTQVGILGSGMEKGLEMAKLALSSTSDAAPGSQFFRDEATLVIIFVSDEPDWSGAWTSYINFFDNIKDPGLLYPVSIIGDYPTGCYYQSSQGNRSAGFGEGYYELTNYYYGDLYSICAADWGAQMQQLANNVVNRVSFSLTEVDVMESSIEVRVNGQLVSEWVWDSVTNSVRFNEGAIPEEGNTIEISYATWGC